MSLMGACFGILNGGVYREFSFRRAGATALGALAGHILARVLLRAKMRKVPASEDGWRAYYRKRLEREVYDARSGGALFLVFITLIQATQEIWPPWNTGNLTYRAGYLAAAWVLAVAIKRPRARRLQREWGGLA
jgi:hypothetical protein